MALTNNIVALIRGNCKLGFLKLFYFNHIKYSPFLRVRRCVEFRIDKNSIMSLGKGVLINSGTVVSSTDGGFLLVGENVGFNNNTMVFCHERIEIGDNTIMGPGVYIYDHDHCYNKNDGVKRNDYTTAPVSIGRNCWIGAGTIILKGSSIGDNCLVAAGCVIKGNYEPGTVIIQKRSELIK